MVDTVINGTRTSRSILGNLSIPEDWAAARALLIGAGWPIDLGPLNPAGLSQKGTDLNKSTLLKDTTAALYGLGTDATPDDVLQELAKIKIVIGSYVGTTSYQYFTLGFKPKFFFVSTEYDSGGVIGLGTTVIFGFILGGSNNLIAIRSAGSVSSGSSNYDVYLSNSNFIERRTYRYVAIG